MMGVAGVLGAALLCAIHGATVERDLPPLSLSSSRGIPLSSYAFMSCLQLSSPDY